MSITEIETQARASTTDNGRLSTLSTRRMEPRLRTPAWEAHNRSHLIGIRAGSPSEDGLTGAIRTVVLDGMSVSEISANSHTVERTTRATQQLPRNSVQLTFVLSGRSFHFDADGPTTVRPNEVAVYDSDRPFLLGFSDDMHAVVASVRRESLDEVGLADSFRRMRTWSLSGGSMESDRARTVLSAVRSAFDTTTGDGRHTVSGVGAAIHQLATPGAGSLDAYFALAMTHIRQYLADPSLSAGAVARAVNVSERHLGRAFARHDTSIAQAIQRARLDEAHHQLSSPGSAHLSAADIGARWGFVSSAHFSRIFKGAFGATPAQVRPRAAGRVA